MPLLKHIVFVKYVDNNYDSEKEKFLLELKSRLELLKGSIAEIITLEVGENISKRNTAFDLSLYVEFPTKKDLNIYSIHPEHVKVLDFMRTRKLETAVVDYIKE